MEIDYNNEAVAAFVAQCDELVNAKFIMSNQKIRMLLKCMAYYDDLRSVIDDCKYNFDYESEYSRAIVNYGTVTVFRLPTSARKKVGLVVCLLLDFDEPRKDIINFLQDFFPASESNDAYKLFCQNLIIPFKEAFLYLLSAEGKQDESESKSFETKKTEVNVAISEQAYYYIKTAIEAVKASKLDSNVRNELIFMLDNFKTVLDMRDAQIIKAFWTGVKYTLQYHKLYNKNMIGLEEVLKAYLVL